MKLIIFDLDQTLVDLINVHDNAAGALFQQFYGVDARFTQVNYAGRSIAENFRELARRNGISEKDLAEGLPRMLETYDRIFAKIIPRDSSAYILPGARELLEELSKTDHLVVLYTGDSPEIVKHVFRTTGLGKYFRFAFYGTQVAARADMVKLAIEKAQEITGRTFRGKDIVIIGDSVRDIECGQLFQALTIAVATGPYSAAELSGYRPDYLFESLADHRKVREAIEKG